MRNEAIILMMASTIVAVLLWASGSEAFGQEPAATAIAAFDNHDSSGEAGARTAQHAAHVEGFAGLLGDRLAERGRYRVVAIDCAEPPCSAGSMTSDALVRAAPREAGGARDQDAGHAQPPIARLRVGGMDVPSGAGSKKHTTR